MKWGAKRGKTVCDRVTISFGVTFEWMKTLERENRSIFRFLLCFALKFTMKLLTALRI